MALAVTIRGSQQLNTSANIYGDPLRLFVKFISKSPVSLTTYLNKLMAIFDKKTKLLLHKLGYLRLEIETKKSELEEHEKEFTKRYQDSEEKEVNDVEENKQNNSCDVAANTQEEEKPTVEQENKTTIDEDATLESSSTNTDVTDDIKKIWKQIAVKTHPDRTGNDPDLTEIYMKSLNAYNQGNYEEVIETALQLFIKIEQLSEKTLELLEGRAKTLEKDLNEIKNNVLWNWAEAPTEKKTIIENMLRKHRKKKKRR